MAYMGYGQAPPPVAYGGGYAAAPPPVGVGYYPPAPPPAPAEPQLLNWFNSVNVDRSGSMTVVELQRALDKGDWAPFDLETIKLLMNLFFSGIWRYIKDWQNVFRHFDRDHSGSIDANELRDALKQFGYHLTPSLTHLVESKYASPVTYGVRSGITFDRFVRACVVIKQTTESFKSLDTNGNGWITIDYDRFMEIALSLP